MSWLQRVRAFIRPPRRLRVLRGGAFVIAGTLALGFATLNTGNNLLYLLLGALLGLISLSGWMSEHALRGLRIVRTTPVGMEAGTAARITYTVTKQRGWLPAYDIEIRELRRALSAADRPPPDITSPAYALSLQIGTPTRVRSELTAVRGVHDLSGLTLATTFPFGLFRKERDIALPGTLVVWPRTDRPVREPATAAARGRRQYAGAAAAAARTRGDYRGLRPYRSGDDRRDIHWRSSARIGQPVVREYELDAADEYWVVVDTGAPDAAAGEAVLETAASLIVRAAQSGDRCGLAVGTARVEPGQAPGRVQGLLDVLAAVHMSPEAARPMLPAAAEACVLVTARDPDGLPWGDVFHVTGAET